MNLMFYDFNGSSFGTANNTAQNFYKPGDQDQPTAMPDPRINGPVGPNDPNFRNNFRAEGDRVPTRERGYRSANQNMRRRDLHKKNLENLQARGGAAGAAGAAAAMSSVNETADENLNEHQNMIPQGL